MEVKMGGGMLRVYDVYETRICCEVLFYLDFTLSRLSRVQVRSNRAMGCPCCLSSGWDPINLSYRRPLILSNTRQLLRRHAEYSRRKESPSETS